MSTIDQKIWQAIETDNLEDLLDLVEEKYTSIYAEEFGGDPEDFEYDIAGNKYQWLRIAEDFGNEEAEEYADNIAEEYDINTEIIAGPLYLELGRMYLLGERGVPQDEEKGFKHLQTATDNWSLNELRKYDHTDAEILEEDLEAIRDKLNGNILERFNRIFPEKNSL